jgi:hypothetical protein
MKYEACLRSMRRIMDALLTRVEACFLTMRHQLHINDRMR